ncbi:unnamed protein product [Arabidopsis arenosa]|uniref:DUF1204 domain-containing protein n=1 Tax=Arabidopsis arenosa TaxID=38785 RepID=A0A8S2AWY8_ARAAE|nr:unnamed protein product [Arabidopsis arenosa]
MSRFPEDYVREELEVDEYRQLEQTLDGFGADQDAWIEQTEAGDTLADLNEEDAQYLDSLLAPENVEAGPSSSRRGKIFEHLVREVTPIVMGLRAPSTTTNPRKNRSRKAEAVIEESSTETCFSYGHGKSASTLDSLKKMFTQCQLPANVEFLVPEAHERPSDCPDGYICVYEPYFTECGLWFPLPEFLTSYCSRRNIAFSQLSVASIRNAVGLVIMAAEENIVVNLNLFEAVTTFSIGQKNPGIVCASSRRRFKIVYDARRKTNDWRKRYFFVKLNEASVEDIHLSCDNVWKMDPGFAERPDGLTDGDRSSLDILRAKRALSWPHVLDHFRTCSYSCLRMGDCVLPSYADQFDEDVAPLNGNGPQGLVNEAGQGVFVEAVVAEDARAEPEASRRARSAEVDAARARKKVSRGATGSAPPSAGGGRSRKRTSRRSPEAGPSNVGRSARREEPVREACEGVDHSFSFNYGAKNHMFHYDGDACAELASKIRGDFTEFPRVDSLLGADLYRDVARRNFQSMSQMNRLVGFYEEKVRAAMRENDLLKAALEAAKRSVAARTGDYESEKAKVGGLDLTISELREQLKAAKAKLASEVARLRKARDEIAAVERHKAEVEAADNHARIERLRKHIIGLRAQSIPKYTLCQVKGIQECLEKMINKGTVIPEERMARLAADRPAWQRRFDEIVVPDIFESDLEPLQVPPRDGARGANE